MNNSLLRLHKYLKLEAENGYNNRAVIGGLERILDSWEPEAHLDALPEELIVAVVTRLRDYARITPVARGEALQGLWQRLRREIDPGMPGLPQPKRAQYHPTSLKASQAVKPNGRCLPQQRLRNYSIHSGKGNRQVI